MSMIKYGKLLRPILILYALFVWVHILLLAVKWMAGFEPAPGGFVNLYFNAMRDYFRGDASLIVLMLCLTYGIVFSPKRVPEPTQFKEPPRLE